MVPVTGVQSRRSDQDGFVRSARKLITISTIANQTPRPGASRTNPARASTAHAIAPRITTCIPASARILVGNLPGCSPPTVAELPGAPTAKES
jgi:hypothetical protein